MSHAWGALEEAQGNMSGARAIYSRSASLNPQPEVCVSWASLEVT